MNKKLTDALGEIDEKYIAQAAKKPRQVRRMIFSAVAALLALILVLKIPGMPLLISARAVAAAPQSGKMKRPRSNSPQWDQWYQAKQKREGQVAEIQPAIQKFAGDCSRVFLDAEENRLWSPVNAYLGLAITAELAGGQTRQAVLEVLGAPDLDRLRQGSHAVWEDICQDDGKEISILANSLWLDEQLQYQQDTMELLANTYYTSIFQGNLSDSRIQKDMGAWIHNETQGFLGRPEVQLDANAVMTLISTVYFRSKWAEPFSRSKNSEDVFHAPDGDVICTFMTAKELEETYFWGEPFGAVALHLQNGCRMWLILPDEGKTVGDVLNSGAYIDLFRHGYENNAYKKINLMLPKFDISCSAALKPALEELGLSALFCPVGNDFSASVISEEPTYLDDIRQKTRVQIDEEGVTAASYVEFDFGCGAAAPPEEIIDFTLDRPFLFAITSDAGIPIFMGTVQTPG